MMLEIQRITDGLGVGTNASISVQGVSEACTKQQCGKAIGLDASTAIIFCRSSFFSRTPFLEVTELNSTSCHMFVSKPNMKCASTNWGRSSYNNSVLRP